MEKPLVVLDKDTICSSWNYFSQRLASGSADKTFAIFDSLDSCFSSFFCTSKSKVHEAVGIVKIAWVPWEFGVAVACLCRWNFIISVIDSVSTVGHAICLFASISWNPQRGESQESSFVLGFNSNAPQLNSAKVSEFDQAHQRWLPVAELASPSDNGDQVYAVAWALNIGRPYEVIVVATHKGISIWHLGLNLDLDGRLSLEKIALLSGHKGEVWQMELDMSGMTLATTKNDGAVRL
ncbi:hypothetical protein DVH24_040039 [Malus domestica]|uniref:Uncharacterized protein n=1 Tax=Malus domestica TaxID=3750 RepID=A0A498I2M9_MALDO|nr:hypothetical protein DVH24_040039 [Malus domestica]